MKTIHITSQDDLPDVAEAVIEALGRRTVVAFRGEMDGFHLLFGF